METLLISLGGATGAVSRYLVGKLLAKTSFPWATLLVNVLGSFLLGIVLLGRSSSEVQLLVGVGFCGAFTTFSSFSFQTISLWERGEQTSAALNAFGNLIISWLAFAVAWILVG